MIRAMRRTKSPTPVRHHRRRKSRAAARGAEKVAAAARPRSRMRTATPRSDSRATRLLTLTLTICSQATTRLHQRPRVEAGSALAAVNAACPPVRERGVQLAPSRSRLVLSSPSFFLFFSLPRHRSGCFPWYALLPVWCMSQTILVRLFYVSSITFYQRWGRPLVAGGVVQARQPGLIVFVP